MFKADGRELEPNSSYAVVNENDLFQETRFCWNDCDEMKPNGSYKLISFHTKGVPMAIFIIFQRRGYKISSKIWRETSQPLNCAPPGEVPAFHLCSR